MDGMWGRGCGAVREDVIPDLQRALRAPSLSTLDMPRNGGGATGNIRHAAKRRRIPIGVFTSAIVISRLPETRPKLARELPDNILRLARN